jgi:hypothetical protein
MGFREAAALASILHKILRDGCPLNLLETYNREQQNDWRRLLAINGGLKARSEASPWIAKHCARILPCLPAGGADLEFITSQLGLGFP